MPPGNPHPLNGNAEILPACSAWHEKMERRLVEVEARRTLDREELAEMRREITVIGKDTSRIAGMLEGMTLQPTAHVRRGRRIRRGLTITLGAGAVVALADLILKALGR
jgi:hypothetical protein